MAAVYTTLEQLGVPLNQSPITEDISADDVNVSRLNAEFPAPPNDTYGFVVAGPAGALLAADQDAPAAGSARYLKIKYNNTDLWICCSQVHLP